MKVAGINGSPRKKGNTAVTRLMKKVNAQRLDSRDFALREEDP